MMKPSPLSGPLKPSSRKAPNTAKAAAPPAAKRKYTSVQATFPDLDEKSEDELQQEQRPTKKASIKKAAAKKASTKTAEGGGKAAGQLYTKLVGDVDKRVNNLDARVKKMSPNDTSVTSDTYAKTMIHFVQDVRKLMEMGQEGAKLAFNIVLYIGPHMHGDFEASAKMCGFGENEKAFADMDELMLEVIARREDVDCGEDTALPEVRPRWTRKDADVGVFKTGRPNKQQRGQIDRQRAKWIKDRNDALKQRRENAVVDWISNGIFELKDEQDYIGAYGLDGYFSKSIAKLEAMKAGRQ
jgi:hypothetical protein